MTGSTKPDLDRLGYFREMSYITIGDPYIDLGKFVFNEDSCKGKQLYGISTKSKCGLNDGYFTPYNRLFIGESYTDMTKIKHEERLKEKIKEGVKAFLPPSGSKQLIGSGSYWGTFSQPISYFRNEFIKSIKSSDEKNFYTSPSKKGAGSSYPNVTIGKLPAYVSEPYLDNIDKTNNIKDHKNSILGRKSFIQCGNIDYFGPDPYKQQQGIIKRPLKPATIQTKRITIPFRPSNPGKEPGGYKAGTFNPFPNYISEPYIDPYKRIHSHRDAKVFIPSSGPKSARFDSILTRNVNKTINSSNFDTVKSVIYS
ncbi:unnamed protein product [Schistosoma rodhaini]|uniref:Cilia-and flagella-associated protein 96 n=1 Tax=Schistosoma mansoni TaxID=6183 RepID=G4VBF9_SCHMA|nr:hypothetical protein Smp_102390 [Schistosoma mansoni]CAH8526951.1 unnamed protein product [Schistosoma rodhaini]|eukprot:XP_018649857.1 hypothetical protein Smp_102390 [Schistosoma mansoni]